MVPGNTPMLKPMSILGSKRYFMLEKMWTLFSSIVFLLQSCLEFLGPKTFLWIIVVQRNKCQYIISFVICRSFFHHPPWLDIFLGHDHMCYQGLRIFFFETYIFVFVDLLTLTQWPVNLGVKLSFLHYGPKLLLGYLKFSCWPRQNKI